MPIRLKNTCPVVILIPKRNERVTGRINFLISSTKLKNPPNTKGLPNGTKWPKKLKTLFSKDENFIKRKKHKEKNTIKNKWEVKLKMNGTKPKRLE